jgi:hypothetical protein
MRVISLPCALLYGQIQASADQDHRLIYSMQILAHDDRSASAASQQCLRLCMRAIVRRPMLYFLLYGVDA